MKEEDLFTEQNLVDAVDELATLPYFPGDERGVVMMRLRRMCPTRTALQWLVDETMNHLDRWPGLAELRGILCTRYTPADGIDHWSTLPGYRAQDAEARFLEGHEQLKLQGPPCEEARAMLKQLAHGLERKRATPARALSANAAK